MSATCSPSCLCHKPSYGKSVTAGGVNADAEEQWFNDVCDAVDEYLRLYAIHRETPKADQAPIAEQMHEAKSEVIERFYAKDAEVADMRRAEWRIA